MLISLKAVTGLLFVRSLITRVILTKCLFVHEIEEGGEIFIPHELSQDSLAYSFRYYDPVLSFIQDNISDERRDYFTLKN